MRAASLRASRSFAFAPPLSILYARTYLPFFPAGHTDRPVRRVPVQGEEPRAALSPTLSCLRLNLLLPFLCALWKSRPFHRALPLPRLAPRLTPDPSPRAAAHVRASDRGGEGVGSGAALRLAARGDLGHLCAGARAAAGSSQGLGASIHIPPPPLLLLSFLSPPRPPATRL